MKADIHPTYKTVNVKCSCGNSFDTQSTYDEDVLKVDICSECHPYFTGQQRVVDTEGRVDKFNSRFSKFAKKKLQANEEESG